MEFSASLSHTYLALSCINSQLLCKFVVFLLLFSYCLNYDVLKSTSLLKVVKTVKYSKASKTHLQGKVKMPNSMMRKTFIEVVDDFLGFFIQGIFSQEKKWFDFWSITKIENLKKICKIMQMCERGYKWNIPMKIQTIPQLWGASKCHKPPMLVVYVVIFTSSFSTSFYF